MLAQFRRFMILLLLTGASACATAEPVVRLTAREPVHRWQQGREVLLKERNGLQVALAYDRNYQGYVGFRLEVVNKSEQPVLFDPSQSYSAYCVPSTVGKGAIQCPSSSWLIDPEKMSATLEVQQASQVAQHTNEQSWNTGLLFLGVVGSVAAVSQGHHDSGSDVLHTAARMDIEDARHAASEIRFGNALEFWQAATFRRTTLRPGEASSGLILAQRNANVPIVLMRVQLGSEAFDFQFAQTILNAPSSRPQAGR